MVAEAAGVRCNQHLQREAVRPRSLLQVLQVLQVQVQVHAHMHVQHLQREAARRKHIECRRRIRRETAQQAPAEGGGGKAAGREDNQSAIT